MQKLLVGVALVAASCGGNEPGIDPDAANGDAVPGDGASVDASDGAIDAPVPSTMIDLTLTDRPINVGAFTFLVLYQDGTGPWTHAPAPVGDVYSFPVTSPAYAVAWTCISGQQNTVSLAAFTTAERTNLTMEIPARCTDRITRVPLSGVITSRGNGGPLTVQFGDRTAAVNGQTGAYSLEVRPGTNDLFVVRRELTLGSDLIAERVAVQRALTVTAPTTANVDFSTAANVRSFAVAVNAPIGSRALTTTTLYTATATDPALVRDTNLPYVTRSLAVTQMVSTDVYNQAIIVSTSGQTAMTTTASTAPGALTYVAPPPLGAATSTIAAQTPYPIVRTTWAAYANAIGYRWEAAQMLPGASCDSTTLACSLQWTALVSPAIAGAAPAYQIPDLSMIVGWSPSFQFVTGRPVTGVAQAMTSSVGAGDFPDAIPAAGTKRTYARSDWAVTP